MSKSPRALRYRSADDMPPGMRRLVVSTDRAAADALVRDRIEPRAYNPPAKTTGDQVARGRPRHVAGEMNKTEAAYAAELEARKAAGEVAWWAFESVKLRLAKNTTLTVDFFVMLANGELEAHEVKGGHWEDDARVKVKVAAELYPFRFLAVQKVAGGGWKVETFSP